MIIQVGKLGLNTDSLKGWMKKDFIEAYGFQLGEKVDEVWEIVEKEKLLCEKVNENPLQDGVVSSPKRRNKKDKKY